jgi:CCR4-NOT transcription complex subunit 1
MIRSFDLPDRSGVDTPTLKLLIAILLSCPATANPHAVTGFWQEWSNPLYQLRLLDALLSLPADTFSFVSLSGRRIVTVDDVSGASPTIKSLAANVQGHTWNSLDLFEVLVKLAGSDSQDIRTCVRDMLDKAVRISAELVHMGLLQVPVCVRYLNYVSRIPDSRISKNPGTISGLSTLKDCLPCSLEGTPITSSSS